MKATKYRIPKGWKMLRKGTLIKDGDRWGLGFMWEFPGSGSTRISDWLETDMVTDYVDLSIYIRRIKKKGRGK